MSLFGRLEHDPWTYVDSPKVVIDYPMVLMAGGGEGIERRLDAAALRQTALKLEQISIAAAS